MPLATVVVYGTKKNYYYKNKTIVSKIYYTKRYYEKFYGKSLYKNLTGNVLLERFYIEEFL